MQNQQMKNQKTKNTNHISPLRQQRGIALIIVLCLLIVLTLIGLSGLQTSVQNEQIGYNQRERDLGFQAAESSLRDGEHWIQTLTIKPTAVSTCGTPPCLVWQRDIVNFANQTTSWWSAQSRVFSGSLPKITQQPTYVVEELLFIPYELSPDAASKGQGYHYYRITSRGVGAQDTTIVILESVFGTQFN